MSCPYTNELQNYLDENLSSEKMKAMEEHIDLCHDCQDTLDELLHSPLDLKKQSIEIDDEILVEKIKAHRKGIRRIALYGTFGFILGLFSHYYTNDSFIVTKAIMALPYKIAEFMLGIFFSHNQLSQWDLMYYGWQRGMGFFPHNPLLEYFVEIITPALVAMFLAMMLGYLVSDNRVFQRKKILRFILFTVMIFTIWFGGIYGFYRHTLQSIDRLENLRAVTIYEKQVNSLHYLLRIDEHSIVNTNYDEIINGISNASPTPINVPINQEEGLELHLQFKGSGEARAHVDIQEGIMLLRNRIAYQLSEDTMELLWNITRGEENED